MNNAKIATATSAICLLGRIVGQAEVLMEFQSRARGGDPLAERYVNEATAELRHLVKKYREQSRLTARL